MLQALIFDFDGTIADTVPVCVDAFRLTVEPILGRPLTLDDVRSYFGPTEEGVFQKHFPDRQEELCEEYFRRYSELQRNVPETAPGIMELIRDVKNEGVRVALVTAKGQKSCRISLDFYGIANEFEEIRVGGAEGRIKDVSIRDVLSKMGIAPENSIYVGDAVKDVVSAHKAGVPCWSAAWFASANPEKILENNPEKIFYSVAEMRKKLKKEGVLK